MNDSRLDKNVQIQQMTSGPNPMVCSVWYRNLCDIESKTFFKSMSSISDDSFLLMVLCMLIKLMIQLAMLFPVIYAFCCLLMRFRTAGFILTVI